MTKPGSTASMTMPPARAGGGSCRGAGRAAMVVAMAGSLAACATQGGTTEERMGSNLVSPGKFRFYSCEHLARQTVLMTTRAMELEGLIAKAGPGAGGSFVSAIAYRPEYLQVRGNLVELRKEQAEKNCAPPPTVAAPVHPAAAKPRARPKRS